MVYKDMVLGQLTQTAIDERDNVYFKMAQEVEEVYRKAEAYDLLKEDLLINEKVFKQQAENDEVSAIIHGHYLALLEQSELEDKQND